MKKIVLTGAPSSGKTSALNELRKLNKKGLVLVPESALVLLNGGYPAPDHGDLEQIKAFQQIIISLHNSLEFIFEKKNPSATHMILDRAKLDGTSFWPPGPEDYLKTFNVDLKKELKAYDCVIFLEIPLEKYFGGLHKGRFHDYQQSVESGEKLERIWSQHSNFIKVPAQSDFNRKIKSVLKTIEDCL